MKKNKTIHFALCLDNEGYRSSLEVGKLYQTIPDKEAEGHGLTSVIDESGEEYAFWGRAFSPYGTATHHQEDSIAGFSRLSFIAKVARELVRCQT